MGLQEPLMRLMIDVLKKTRYEFHLYEKTEGVPKPTPCYDSNFGKQASTLLFRAPRYELYLYEKTKGVPKPIPRYDPNFGKQASTLLCRAPRYDPRYGAYPELKLKIITWNVLN